MITREQYQDALGIVLQYKQQCLDEIKDINQLSLSGTSLICNWDFTTRTRNRIKCLLIDRGIDYRTATMYELTQFSESDFKSISGMGYSSLTEIVQELYSIGLKLKENGC